MIIPLLREYDSPGHNKHIDHRLTAIRVKVNTGHGWPGLTCNRSKAKRCPCRCYTRLLIVSTVGNAAAKPASHPKHSNCQANTVSSEHWSLDPFVVEGKKVAAEERKVCERGYLAVLLRLTLTKCTSGFLSLFLYCPTVGESNVARVAGPGAERPPVFSTVKFFRVIVLLAD
jgi:hypothetical protein